MWIGSRAYLGLVGLLLWQALRGESVIHPDPATLIAAAILLAMTRVAAVTVWIGRSSKNALASHAAGSDMF